MLSIPASPPFRKAVKRLTLLSAGPRALLPSSRARLTLIHREYVQDLLRRVLSHPGAITGPEHSEDGKKRDYYTDGIFFANREPSWTLRRYTAKPRIAAQVNSRPQHACRP